MRRRQPGWRQVRRHETHEHEQYHRRPVRGDAAPRKRLLGGDQRRHERRPATLMMPTQQRRHQRPRVAARQPPCRPSAPRRRPRATSRLGSQGYGTCRGKCLRGVSRNGSDQQRHARHPPPAPLPGGHIATIPSPARRPRRRPRRRCPDQGGHGEHERQCGTSSSAIQRDRRRHTRTSSRHNTPTRPGTSPSVPSPVHDRRPCPASAQP